MAKAFAGVFLKIQRAKVVMKDRTGQYKGKMGELGKLIVHLMGEVWE